MQRPDIRLPEVARVILKGVIVSLGNTGLVNPADVSLMLALLGLQED